MPAWPRDQRPCLKTGKQKIRIQRLPNPMCPSHLPVSLPPLIHHHRQSPSGPHIELLIAFDQSFLSRALSLVLLNSQCSPHWPQTHSSRVLGLHYPWLNGCVRHCPCSKSLHPTHLQPQQPRPTSQFPCLLCLHLLPLRVLFPYCAWDPQPSHLVGNSLRLCSSHLSPLAEFLCSSWSLSK